MDNELIIDKSKYLKCPECQSVNLEYLPNVDGQSWVNVKYEQRNGKWVIVAKGNLYNNIKDEDDVSVITSRDIFYNDSMSFFYCKDCTSEIDGRYI